ncbi:MAG: thiolase domain-containing protein [bacterium]|nr:thiolase domain-containing protein [bacterium]
MRDVAVVGIGMNNWGELWDKDLRDLYVEAALLAIDDAGVDHIDSMYIGCMSSGLFNCQEHIGSLMSDYLGMNPIPATRVESACASGGIAVRMGFMEVAGGFSDIVLVGGVEKMTDVSGDGATFALATACDQEWEAYNGITFPGLYAMMARAHMHKYGTTREQIAMVSVKNHANGMHNPRAQYHLTPSVQDVIDSVKVAEPLNILDCSPITDGAAAIILTTVENAKKLGKPIIKIIGAGQATNTIALHDREDITRIQVASDAAEKAYKMAGKTPKDIDFAEVHDCFTIAELIVMEELGFCKRGKSGPAVEAGETKVGGRIPINTSGGLKSKGHPVGATGVAQIITLVEQLRGEMGKCQVKGAKVGLAQNMGGSGGSCTVTILEAMS